MCSIDSRKPSATLSKPCDDASSGRSAAAASRSPAGRAACSRTRHDSVGAEPRDLRSAARPGRQPARQRPAFGRTRLAPRRRAALRPGAASPTYRPCRAAPPRRRTFAARRAAKRATRCRARLSSCPSRGTRCNTWKRIAGPHPRCRRRWRAARRTIRPPRRARHTARAFCRAKIVHRKKRLEVGCAGAALDQSASGLWAELGTVPGLGGSYDCSNAPRPNRNRGNGGFRGADFFRADCPHREDRRNASNRAQRPDPRQQGDWTFRRPAHLPSARQLG